MEQLNVIHQVNELKKILSYASKIGFFFGAGTSCAFGLPNVATLTTDIGTTLPTPEQDRYATIKSRLESLAASHAITVEDILNHIRQIREITYERDDQSYGDLTGKNAKELDQEICARIFSILKSCEDSSDISLLQKFFAWYTAVRCDGPKEIFTTNYDMLLEMAMEKSRIPYFDGFVGSYEPFFWPEGIDISIPMVQLPNQWIRLWKIHGSLNWELKPDEHGVLDRIIRTGRIDKPQNELMIYPSREKYSLSRKQPFIAYFDRLKDYLFNGEIVFFISGYSFSDQHINEIIMNGLRQNPRLYTVVFCYSDQQVTTMEETCKFFLNICVMGPTKVLLNGKLYSWIYDNSQEDDTKYQFYWDKKHEKFTLGDFKNLIEFFIEHSGRRAIIEEAVNGK